MCFLVDKVTILLKYRFILILIYFKGYKTALIAKYSKINADCINLI